MTVFSEAIKTARKFHQSGDIAQAEQIYNQILELDSNDAIALHGLGWIAYKRGQLREAIEWLRRAAAAEESNAAIFNNLGAVCRAAGRLSEAEACFVRALTLKPDFAEAYNNVANVLKEQGRLEEAVTRYRQALVLRPNYADADNNLAMALKTLGRHGEAIEHLLKAVRLQPDSSTLHSNLGLLFNVTGQSEEALVHLSEALRLQPDCAAAHVNLAFLLLKQGRVQEAVAHFEEAVRGNPQLPDVHNALGFAFLRMQQMDMALAHFEQARRLMPASGNEIVPAHDTQRMSENGSADETQGAELSRPGLSQAATLHNSAAILRKIRKLSEAEAECRQALRIDPEYADAFITLGLILEDQGRLQEAATAFHHALRIQPDHALAFMHIGRALREEGHLERALGYLRHALDLKPDLAEAHVHLGLTLSDRGKLDEAAAAYRQALRLRPELASALSYLGGLLDELGQPEEGRQLLERALAGGAEQYLVHFQFGALLVNQGRFDEARSHFRTALELQPDYSPVYFALARDSKFSFSDGDRKRMESLLAREDLPLRDRVNFNLAMARVLDRAQEYDTAFRHCAQGNSAKHELLKLQGNAFDSARHARFVDRLITTFDSEYFRKTARFGSESDRPVFIVGMPRSGTSLVEQILASHPSVFGAGEIRTMRQLVADIPAELGSNLDYPECLASLDQAAACSLAERYLDALRRLGGDSLRVTDKVPMNFHQLGLIATLFPRCHIIHCRRDPRDVCWSCYFQNFREVHFAADLETLGNYYRQYTRLMDHWEKVLPVPILEVSYEHLVECPEQVSRQIVAFCDLPWHEASLDFHRTQRSVRTSSNIQVRQPIYKSSVGYWRNYERHLRSLLQVLE